MAVIVTRESKGSALTTAQLDANFTNLNTELAAKVTNTANPTFTGTVTFTDSSGVSLVVSNYPVTQPSLMLDFLNSQKLDSRIIFTRTGTATRISPDGLVETVAVNAPRFDYDSVTGAPRGLLIEEARTNLLLSTEDFSRTWGSANATLVSDAAVSPSGTQTGTLLTTSVAGSAISQTTQTFTAGSTITISVFAKRGTSNFLRFEIQNLVSVWFNLNTGVVASNSAGSGNVVFASKNIQAYPGGWYRCSVTVTTSTITTLAVLIYATDTDGSSSSVDSSIYLWGAQAEVGLFSTSYIPAIPTFSSRTFPATYTDSTGTLRIAPPSTARYQHTSNDLGLAPYLLLESARTNSIRNNLVQGAVAGTPGTLPTNWGTFANSGLTTSVVGTGIQKGITYIDLKISGTSTGTVYVLAFDTTAATASAGQTWTESFWCSLVAGSITNVVSVNVNLRQTGGAGNTFDRVFTPTAAFTRFTSSGTLTTGATDVYGAIFISVTNSAAVDITLRIGMPQLELGASATSVIATPTFASRASGGRYISSNGSLVLETSSNVARYQYDPLNLTAVPVLLMEEARTNSIRNNTMTGATAGTPGIAPTNWGIGTNSSGLSTSVIGTGTEAGVTYIDVRFFGTTTVATEFFITPEPGTNVTATNGQIWTGSFYAKIVAGSTTNLTSVNVITRVVNSSGTGLTAAIGSSGLNLLSANSLVTNRFFATVTAADATTAAAQTYFRATHSSGVAVDITLRIGMPQLEQGSGSTSVIGTSIGAVARAADVYTTVAVTRAADTTSSTSSQRGADIANMLNIASWYNQTEWSIFAQYDSLYTGSVTTNAQRPHVWALNNTTVSVFDGYGLVERWDTTTRPSFQLRTLTGYPYTVLANYSAYLTAGQVYKSVTAMNSSQLAVTVDNKTIVTATNTGYAQDTQNRLQIGFGDTGGSSPYYLNGHVQRIAYYPVRLTDAEMQLLTL
jgi:hypothetical protein